MSSFLHTVAREVRAITLLPHSFAIAAAYVLISGVFFVAILDTLDSPDLASYYANVASVLVVLAPVVASRAFAEERASGSLGIALSWPASRVGLYLGKLAANVLYTWLLVSVCWIYVLQLRRISSVDMARVVGGYVGLLLLALLFSAIALAVSAWMSSPSAAAFSAFGVLLFLWVVRYAPGWLDTFTELGPSERLDAMNSGVLYLEGVAYFLVLSVVATVVGIAGIDRRVGALGLRTNARRVALPVVAVASVLVTPAVAGAAPGQWDLTTTSRNTLSSASEDLVRRVDNPIRVTAFMSEGGSEASKLSDLVRRYEAAGADIDLTFVDPDLQPGLAREAGATTYNQYVVEVDGRHELAEGMTEISFTSVLSRVAREDLPEVCFTVGHGESSIENPEPEGLTQLAARLRLSGYEPVELALDGPGGADRLERCATVAVMGPNAAFTAREMRMLEQYVSEQGRLLVAADGVEGPLEEFDDLLEPWGLGFGGRGVRDASSLADDPTAVVSMDYPSSARPVAHLAHNDIAVLMVNPVEVTIAGVDADDADALSEDAPELGAHRIPLVRTSEKSWREEGGSFAEAGPFLIAAAADHTAVTGVGTEALSESSRVAAVGGASWATNAYGRALGNQELAVSLIQWLAQETEIVAAYRDPAQGEQFVLTNSTRSDFVRRVLVFPTAACLVLVPLRLWRLKRG